MTPKWTEQAKSVCVTAGCNKTVAPVFEEAHAIIAHGGIAEYRAITQRDCSYA